MNRLAMSLLAVLLFASMAFLQNRRDLSGQTETAREQTLLIFPKPFLVRPLSLGHINLVADFYWLKTIQYLGANLAQKNPPVEICRYADFVTDLSPRFLEAYYYPSVIMIVNQINPAKNLALLEKGEKNLPASKDIAFLLGIVNYYFIGDTQRAAESFRKAYQLSGYRPYGLLATRILAEKGNLELSQSILDELSKGSRNQAWSNSIQDMTNGIQQRKQLDFLNQKIAEYNQTYQKYPNRIQDLTDSGLIAPSQLPSDPFGGQYYIDAGTHQARSTKEYYLGVYRPKAFEK